MNIDKEIVTNYFGTISTIVYYAIICENITKMCDILSYVNTVYIQFFNLYCCLCEFKREHMEKYVGGTYGEVHGRFGGRKKGRSDVIIILKRKNIKRCINLNHPHFRKNNKRKLNIGGNNC